MKRTFLLFLTLLLLLAPALPVQAADPIYDITLDSRGVILMNPETGTVLYEKAADTRMYPASTTKIMTALVCLELCQDPKNEIVTVPDQSMFQYIKDEGGVHMWLSSGEKISAWDLLMGMMIVSYCDASDMLAYHFGGSVDGFVDQMNAKVQEMGLENTHFENAHGLPDANHYSSPRDLALILQEAMKDPRFREIISTRDYTIPKTNRHTARELTYSVDIYYPDNDYYLEEYVGGKSGYTNAAGRCLATYSEKDGTSYISILLGSNLDSSRKYPTKFMCWRETHSLVSYAFENYEIKTIAKAGETIETVPVHDSDTKIPVALAEDVKVLVRKDADTELKLSLPDFLYAEDVKSGEKAGTATLWINGEESQSTTSLQMVWDDSPIPLKSSLEKGAESAWSAFVGIFRQDTTFVILMILLLFTVAIGIPVFQFSRKLQKKSTHRPKH